MPDDDFDVVIVGAGVVGGLIAHDLARRGRSVLMLDAGPSLDLGRGDGDVPRLDLVRRFATENVRGPGAPYHSLPLHGPESDADYTHAADSVNRFKSGYVLGVGGTTWHWLGNVPRMLPGDFAMHTRYGVGVDWPIGYPHLESWYGSAEAALGVAGDHASLDGLHSAYRTSPFPMTEIWPSHSDLVVERALAGRSFEGTPLAVLRTPQARNSRPYDGRPACAGNSICVPLCPIGAKYDGSVHVKKALDVRRTPARLEVLATVTRVVAADNGTITGVEYTQHGQKRTVVGRAVVLAAHAIETPRLLLASGLANRSGQVGRNLMDHTNRFGSIVAREPMFPFRGPPTTSGIDAFRDGSFRRERAAFRLSLGNDGAGRNAPPEAVAMRLVRTGLLGPSLRQAIRREIEPLFRISSSTEMLPSAANEIRLIDGLDRGLPKFEVRFRVDDYTRAGYLHAERVMAAIFDHVGFVHTPTFEAADSYSGAGHIMGTCRMGNSPSTSVVDANCRTHDHPNLFIAGTSLFPTGGTANPTLTAAALALRLAAHLQIWLG